MAKFEANIIIIGRKKVVCEKSHWTVNAGKLALAILAAAVIFTALAGR